VQNINMFALCVEIDMIRVEVDESSVEFDVNCVKVLTDQSAK